jgi:transcriptional regulator with XRE-family HTH domain
MAEPASPDLLRQAGIRVRAAREAAGLTQAQVAKRVGLTRSSLANLEAGRQDMNLTRLALVARVLKLDLNELVALVELPPEPTGPHEVRITPVFKVECLTCGDAGMTDSRAAAQRSKAAHIAAMLEAGDG